MEAKSHWNRSATNIVVTAARRSPWDDTISAKSVKLFIWEFRSGSYVWLCRCGTFSALSGTKDTPRIGRSVGRRRRRRQNVYVFRVIHLKCMEFIECYNFGMCRRWCSSVVVTLCLQRRQNTNVAGRKRMNEKNIIEKYTGRRIAALDPVNAFQLSSARIQHSTFGHLPESACTNIENSRTDFNELLNQKNEMHAANTHTEYKPTAFWWITGSYEEKNVNSFSTARFLNRTTSNKKTSMLWFCVCRWFPTNLFDKLFQLLGNNIRITHTHRMAIFFNYFLQHWTFWIIYFARVSPDFSFQAVVFFFVLFCPYIYLSLCVSLGGCVLRSCINDFPAMKELVPRVIRHFPFIFFCVSWILCPWQQNINMLIFFLCPKLYARKRRMMSRIYPRTRKLMSSEN